MTIAPDPVTFPVFEQFDKTKPVGWLTMPVAHVPRVPGCSFEPAFEAIASINRVAEEWSMTCVGLVAKPVAPGAFADLLKAVCNASFECGEWNKHETDEKYEVVLARSEKAKREIIEWVATRSQDRGVRSFDELFADHNLTAEEREHLVAYLAFMRSQNTIRALRVQAA